MKAELGPGCEPPKELAGGERGREDVIVRLMGEGQWRVDDSRLRAAERARRRASRKAVEAGDEAALWHGLQALADAVRANGEKLDDADLSPSDAIIPPEDLSLERHASCSTARA